jgi:hypothetical protein
MNATATRAPDGSAPKSGEWCLTPDKQRIQVVCPMCVPPCVAHVGLDHVSHINMVLNVCAGCQQITTITLEGYPVPE